VFTLVPAYPGSPGPTAVKRLCACVRACVCVCVCVCVSIDLAGCLYSNIGLSTAMLLCVCFCGLCLE